MTTFNRKLDDAVFVDPARERRGGPKGKDAHQGEQSNFTVDYRPRGQRERANSVTPGEAFARQDNRYGKSEKGGGDDPLMALSQFLRL